MSDDNLGDMFDGMTYYIVQVDEDQLDCWKGFGPFIVPATFVSLKNVSCQSKETESNDNVVLDTWYVQYPDPPFDDDNQGMILDFVTKPQSIPPPDWTEKKCLVRALAADYKGAQELLSKIVTEKVVVSKKKLQTKKKSPKKRKAANMKEPSRRKLIAEHKKNGLGKKMKTLSEAVLNEIQQNNSTPIAMTKKVSSSTVTGALKENSTVYEGDVNQNLSQYQSEPVHHDPHLPPQNILPDASIKKILFDAPSVQDILETSQPKLQEWNEDQRIVLSPQKRLSPTKRATSRCQIVVDPLPEAINIVSLNYEHLQALGPVIVSQIKDHVNVLVENSEKRIMKHVDKKVKELTNVLRSQNQPVMSVLTVDDFKKAHTDFLFPISLDKFKAFNLALSTNANSIRSNLRKHILDTTSSQGLVKDNLKIIFTNLICRDIMLAYTASNSVNDKPTLKSTDFFQVVRDAFLGIYNKPNEIKVTETCLTQLIGKMINSKRSSGNKDDLPNASEEPQNLEE